MLRCRSFTLVEVMIVTLVISIAMAIAIPGVMRARVNANESVAMATLKTISNAFEMYAANNQGQYPTDITAELINSDPSFLNDDYFTQCTSSNPCKGYFYAVSGSLTGTSYTIVGRPAACSGPLNPGSGSKSFSIATGGVLTTDATCTDTP
ncbi:MAG: type II secretion system protein [Candidatus Omnitrophota bacterium]